MDAVAKAQINLTQAEADARKAAIKADAEREPVNESERESACVRAIHEAIMEEEAAVESVVEEIEESEEEEEEELKWLKEKVTKLEADQTAARTEADSRHSSLMSKLDELKPKPLIPSVLENLPSPAPVNPEAMPEQSALDAPAKEQQRRKVRKI